MGTKNVLLLTGRPGVGKTTLVRRLTERFSGKAGGFYTQEMRQHGKRVGFKLVTLDGEEAILAHISTRSRYQVGKYGVSLEGITETGVKAVRRALTEKDLIVVDEIGKMELFSPQFVAVLQEVLEGEKPVVGVIMVASHPIADRIKGHPRVHLIEVREANRDQLLEDLIKRLEAPYGNQITTTNNHP